jgi:hypothetical protein
MIILSGGLVRLMDGIQKLSKILKICHKF